MNFPYLEPEDFFEFPSPSDATPDGLVAAGGNLSRVCLFPHTARGFSPGFNHDDPLLWWSPDPRFVIFPDKIHVSRSMKKLFKKKRFEVSYNSDFESVIRGCRYSERKGQPGTWITDEMEEAYKELYKLGYVLSVEVREPGSEDLAAGLYGVRIGKCFFGESMFSRKPNGSKYGFITSAQKLFSEGVVIIDCQIYTSHLESLGAEMIGRRSFIDIIRNNT